MIEYYKSYNDKEFSKELKRAVYEVGLKPSIEKTQFCVDKICELYGISTPNIILCKSKGFEGMYIGVRKEIVLNENIELIYLLHELRHHIQKETLSFFELSYEDKEHEARMWSSSLFYAVFPEEYLELVRLNKIKYV